jgi:aspartokinase/homoserine dehydrogenase 1
VDGFMTADPRVISTAYTINELSYVEAMELCNFGAKVVYPPTIYPVCHKNIPILIKNTFNPEAPGTIIKQEVDSGSKAIKGISSINDTTLITVTGLGMVGVIGVNFRIFKALAQNGISVFMVSQASSENSTSIGVRNQDAALACEVLNEEFAKEIEMGEISPVVAEMNLATIAIVGENMKHTPGIAGKLFGTLGRNGISVIACAQGASETNISFVVEAKSLRKSLNVIHDSFFLSEYQVLNLFICGTGTVGGSLIEQIRCQQQKLMQERGLKLKVVGIADGHRALFTRAGIDLASYREEMEEKGIPSSAAVLHDEIIGMNIFNSVFVDCTASAEVASLYKEFLMHNISVVAANKIAASSDYSIYSELKQIARRRGVKFLFETNVGAGLPIINTINDLINSGDKILKIEAVLSGTLNYIFNKISANVPFSQTIKMAQEERYSEPDPRIDLSGKDVIRKLVILAREAGYKLEQTDVEKHLFVPSDFFEGPLEEFWKKVPSLDADFEARRRKLESENKRWRFVAKLENGKGSVSLQEVDSKHPFYGLEGSNNIILLTTERYKEYPMMIQGYGAGASVTAAGVFADIMSIANI